MRSLRLLSVLVLSTLFAGCSGYQLGPIKPKLLANVNTLSVNTFKNDTLQPRVEVLLASSVIKQLQQDGTYQVVRDKAADAVVEGTLEEIERRPARSVRGNVLQSKEYNLTLKVKFQVVNQKTGEVILRRTVAGTTSFFVSGSSVSAADVNQDERQALPLAIEDLAVRMVSQLSEGW